MQEDCDVMMRRQLWMCGGGPTTVPVIAGREATHQVLLWHAHQWSHLRRAHVQQSPSDSPTGQRLPSSLLLLLLFWTTTQNQPTHHLTYFSPALNRTLERSGHECYLVVLCVCTWSPTTNHFQQQQQRHACMHVSHLKHINIYNFYNNNTIF